MTDTMMATTTVDASSAPVFAALADPATHAAIDGTGWVRDPLDGERLNYTGQMFRMNMYHDNHPDKHYQMANKVTVFEQDRAIAWEPGLEGEDGAIQFGGYLWRYDLDAAGPQQTTVTLTYDWSASPPEVREQIQFPPFPVEHLENSVANLAGVVTATT